MFEPVSITAGTLLGLASLTLHLRFGSAMSDAASAVRKNAWELMESRETSLALYGNKANAISQLHEMVIECSEDGWNGDGTLAVHPLAVDAAQNFVRALPDDFPMPEFAPEPDGSISLDWITSRYRRLTVSIGVGRGLAFAWMDGSSKGRGTVPFDGSEVPRPILDCIKSITNRTDIIYAATLQAA